MTNAKELKKMMIDHNIHTIKQLSDMTKVNRDTLSKVLSGKAQPSLETMNRLIDVLEIETNRVGEIFFERKLTQNVS